MATCGKTEGEAITKIKTYRNPDERCAYPFSPGYYCWSYAFYIDYGDEWLKKRKVESMEEICHHCEFWTESEEYKREQERWKRLQDEKDLKQDNHNRSQPENGH